MRKFKFRGKDIQGHTWEGDLIHSGGDCYIRRSHYTPIEHVMEDSVVPMLGYIPSGDLGVEERYEGDTVELADGRKARLISKVFAVTDDGEEIEFDGFAKFPDND